MAASPEGSHHEGSEEIPQEDAVEDLKSSVEESWDLWLSQKCHIHSLNSMS